MLRSQALCAGNARAAYPYCQRHGKQDSLRALPELLFVHVILQSAFDGHAPEGKS
jgi:hypothetical protein